MNKILKIDYDSVESPSKGNFDIILKKMIKEKFQVRAKARIRKSKKDINKNIKNFFEWIKGCRNN